MDQKTNEADTKSDDKLAERTQIAIEFGILLQPFFEIAEADDPPPLSRYRLARGQVEAGKVRWAQHVETWCSFGDVKLDREKREIVDSVDRLLADVDNFLTGNYDPETAQVKVRVSLDNARAAFSTRMGQVPFDVEAILSEANTPFTVHLRLADLIATAQQRVHYFDRYLTDDFFPLYLRNIARSIEVRLVTTAGNPQYGIANVQPQAQIAGQEFTNLRLIRVSQNDLHGRHLRIDDSNYNLGSSAQHVGLHPTSIDPGDSSQNGHQVLDTIIASGTRVV